MKEVSVGQRRESKWLGITNTHRGLELRLARLALEDDWPSLENGQWVAGQD